jgi:uncharacterized protein (TIGR02996 family)
MTDRDALLAAVVAHPDDDTPRLVFADWLDDHGEPDRAEFIRAQCQLATTAPDDASRASLEARERAHLTRHATAWTAPRLAFPGRIESTPFESLEGYRSVFRRGFVEAVQFTRLPPEALRPGGEFESVFAAHPVRDITFYHLAEGVLTALAGRRELARVESLSLRHSHPQNGPPDEAARREAEVERLLAAPGLTRLTALAISTSFPWLCRPEWLHLPVFARLQALSLSPEAERFGDLLLELAGGPCPALRHLEVTWWGGDRYADAADAFVRSAACRQITRLRLSCSDGAIVPWSDLFADANLERLEVSGGSGLELPDLLVALAARPRGRTLSSLRLWGVTVTGTSPAVWMEKGLAAGVRDLELSHTMLTDEDVVGLARSPALARLTRLSVDGYQGYTAAGLRALLTSPHLTGLRHLAFNIPQSEDATATLEFLAERRTARRLLSLRIGGSLREGTGVPGPIPLGLLAGQAFPDLHSLRFDLRDARLDASQLRTLLTSPRLPSLRCVRMGFDEKQLPHLAASANNLPEGVWVGGSTSVPPGAGLGASWGHVAVHPRDVFLPNHLDEPHW